MKNLLVVFFLLTLTISKQIFDVTSDELKHDIFSYIFQQLHRQLNLTQSQLHLSSNKALSPTCLTCHAVIKFAKHLPIIAKMPIFHTLQRIAVEYCVLKKIEDHPVCKGAVDQMAGYILQSLYDRYTDPHLLCHQIRLCKKQYQILSFDDYAKDVLKGKPNKTQQKPTGKKILKMLHISDLHPDIFYNEGSPTLCPEPVCCRTDVKALNNSKPAGFWGSNAQCDVPIHTFSLFLDKIKNQKIDFVIWTGDNTAHDIWKQSQGYNTNFTAILSSLIKQKLNTTVFPAKGNHQSYPVNVYDWTKGKQDELNYGLAAAWADFIGPQATETMRQHGYFMVQNKKLNLKVISLNTESGNDQNWVLLRNPTDPGSQLEWMRQELDKSEKINQFVYIIGHIPPNDMMNKWGIRYNALVDRYNYIIRGQYYGHTHNDHMSFFTSLNDSSSRIINQFMVAPSFTTSTYRNPRYRIVDIDADTMRVMDYTQYVLKLQKNYSRTDIPVFQLDYNFLKEYNMTDFSFESLEKYRQRMKNQPNLQKLYTFHQFGGIAEGYSGKQVECSLRTTRQLQSQCNGGQYKQNAFEKFAGPWKKLIH